MDAFPEIATWSDETILHSVRRVRQLFDDLNRRIVHEACHRFLGEVNSHDGILEFGTGDGHLRTWLPQEIRGRILHTEPSELFAQRFQQAHPDARFQQASVYDLPLPNESQSAVLALCVLDALHDPERARQELHRVLRPNGCVLHFLDLGLACMESVFAEEMAQQLVPVPNFLDLVDESFGFVGAPRTTILDDYAVCQRSVFESVIQYLTSIGNSSGPALAEYLQRMGSSPREASQYFMWISANHHQRRQLIGHLLDAMRLTAGYPGLGLEFRPKSSLAFLQKRLADVFSEAAGFRIRCSQVLTARDWREASPHVPSGCRLFARIVGQVVARHLPKPLDLGECLFHADAPAGDTQVLMETGMFVFAAEKISPSN